MLKLDVHEINRRARLALDRHSCIESGCQNDECADYVVDIVWEELARQLHAAGAPDAPFEQQMQEMLAAFTAMQRAGEELPDLDDVTERLAEDAGVLPEYREKMRRTVASLVLDYIRPLFARLTQERDEKDAARDVFARECDALIEERDAAAMRTAGVIVERDLARQACSAAREALDIENEALEAAEEKAKRLTQERDEARALQGEAMRATLTECDALRQRAERAERDLREVQRHEAGARRDCDALEQQNATFRARIAELESRPMREPGSNTLTRSAYERLIAENLTWLSRQPRSLERDHIEAVLRDSPSRVYGASSARPEPGADVVESMAAIAERAYSSAIDARRHNSTWWPSVVRAVLSHLAAMGKEEWPSDTDMALVCTEKPFYYAHARAIRALFRSRLSIVLGALRARVAELESVGGEMVAALDAWGKTCESKDEAYTYTSDDRRCDQAWAALRSALTRKP